MENSLTQLLERNEERVREVLNLLLESPYFYRSDNPDIFGFLRRNEEAFFLFFQTYYDWTLIVDSKCARVYKKRWYNKRISEANQDVFSFTKRDECIAFMLLLEFFEHQLEEYSLTIEDDNLCFRFGDLLGYVHRRFSELYPERIATCTEEFIRANILRPIIPELVKYRFLTELPRPKDLRDVNDTIYEAMPALYHYNAVRLSRPVMSSNDTDAILGDNSEESSTTNSTEAEMASEIIS